MVILGILSVFQIIVTVIYHQASHNEVTQYRHDRLAAFTEQSQEKSSSQTYHPSKLCTQLSSPPTFSHQWKSLLPILLEGLIHPRDTHQMHRNWTRDLLEDLLTPHVLEYAIQSQPSSGMLLQALTARHGGRASSPLQMAVLGGSVVEGTGCLRSPIANDNAPPLSFASLQECAWPFRFEHALNHILNALMNSSGASSSSPHQSPQRQKWIQVHNLAAGGTHTGAAIPMLQYKLSPILAASTTASNQKSIDIVVNAYSANDHLPPAYHASTNTTIDAYHLGRILQRNLAFLQASKTMTCGSSSPLILYVNDYLGNQQDSIIGDCQLHPAIQWMADMEPTMGYLGVSQAVQRWVYADTSESFFSGNWQNRHGQPAINVHFGQAGHVTTTIGLLYYLLKLLYEDCHDYEDASTAISTTSSVYDWVDLEIPTKDWVQAQRPSPSLLHPNLTEWYFRQQRGTSASCDSLSPRTCPLAFLAAPLGTHHTADELELYLKPFILHNHAWSVRNDFRQGGFQNKLGWVADESKAHMVLQIPYDDPNQIQVLQMHYLKSYGDLWAESRLEVRAQWVRMKDQTTEEHILEQQVVTVEGSHDQAVSISYSLEMHLSSWKEPSVNDGTVIVFRLQLTLIGGKTFKINALLICPTPATQIKAFS